MTLDTSSKTEKKASTGEHRWLLLQLSSDFAQLAFKALLVMNSGALAAILIAITRSSELALASVVIEKAEWFAFGLTFAIVGLVLYVPYEEGIEEIKEDYQKHKTQIGFATLFVIGSGISFLVGVWRTLGGLEDALNAAASKSTLIFYAVFNMIA